MKTKDKSNEKNAITNVNGDSSVPSWLIRQGDFGGTEWFSRREVVGIYMASMRTEPRQASDAAKRLIRL